MIIDYITNEWQTKNKILKKMQNDDIILNERAFRRRIEIQNDLYCKHLSNTFILHSSRGYKLASSSDEIIASVKDNRKRAMNLLKKESKILKALSENANEQFSW